METFVAFRKIVACMGMIAQIYWLYKFEDIPNILRSGIMAAIFAVLMLVD